MGGGATTTLFFRLLGPLTVSRDGVPVAIGPGKQRALLTGLLLDTGRPQSIDRLVTLLWDERPPTSAMANIRTYAARLRTALADPGRPTGSRLERSAPGYLVCAGPAELDTLVFGALVAEGRQAIADRQWQTAQDHLDRALRQWSGSAAAEDVVRGDALAVRLAVFDELRLTALEDLAAARLALGRHAELVPELRALVADHPLRERLWVRLISALNRTGDIQGALDAYAVACRTLRTELGVEPGPELVRLHRAVLDRDPRLMDAGEQPRPVRIAAVRPSRTRIPRELPPDRGDLVGRARESHLIDRLLAVRRRPAVVIVHGPAGAGRSALAIRAAHRNAGRFADGQLYANLFDRATARPVPPDQVVAHFLRALGLPGSDLPPAEAAARLRSGLADRKVLMVLDDCVDEAQVRPLLPAGASAALIVSWRPLGALDGAARVGVGALTSADAATLVSRLVGHVRPDPAELSQLVERCGHLPLALRVVATRLATGTPAELIAQLADEPLDALTAGDVCVRESLRASCHAVAASPAGAAAIQLLGLLGLFRTPAVDTGLVAALLDAGRPAAVAALAQLADVCLLERVGPDRWRVPMLVRSWAVEIGLHVVDPAQREAALHRLLAHLIGLVEPLAGDGDLVGRLVAGLAALDPRRVGNS